MAIEVIEASPDDAAPIAALQAAGVKAAFGDILPAELVTAGSLDFRARQWRGWIERTHTSTFVTREEGTLTGFGTIHPAPEQVPNERTAEIAALYVLPSHWRRGLGRALGERCLAEAGARGFSSLLVWEFAANDAAAALCSALGLRPSGRQRAFLEGFQEDILEIEYSVDLGGS